MGGPMRSPVAAPACNISPRGRNRRRNIGLLLIAAGVIASFLSKNFLGQVVAFFGFLSWFQAQTGT